jgi:hypothetical protein
MLRLSCHAAVHSNTQAIPAACSSLLAGLQRLHAAAGVAQAQAGAADGVPVGPTAPAQ